MPLCRSRVGAAHRRRGLPCQDASLSASLLSGDGVPVQVMAVADGHGHRLHWRSEVGSRLACQVAIDTVRAWVGSSAVAARPQPPGDQLQAADPAASGLALDGLDIGGLEDWQHWLAEELPTSLCAAWLAAIRKHWDRNPEGQEVGGGFSALPYGSTLGVVLMTPQWWGVTGLGDWDLVRLNANGEDAALISEEAGAGGPGEATLSLCLEGAERLFRHRAVLWELTEASAPVTLLLGSDGVRKSCGSDQDFLLLARYLAGLAGPGQTDADLAELDTALDRVSREGSGDDVSVAIGRLMATDS